ncbi:hypothetical protein Agub_g1239, partial [Astrephomene gubernaculifera]
GWMNYGEDYATKTLKLNISSIKQRIAVLPNEMNAYCPWAGLASVGCGGTRCFVWANGGASGDLSLYFHEMGHNLGLMHSNRVGSDDEYGDYTCAMGSLYGCYNAPNNWRMGWGSPIPGGHFNNSNMPKGTWMPYVLPFQTRAVNSSI